MKYRAKCNTTATFNNKPFLILADEVIVINLLDDSLNSYIIKLNGKTMYLDVENIKFFERIPERIYYESNSTNI